MRRTHRISRRGLLGSVAGVSVASFTACSESEPVPEITESVCNEGLPLAPEARRMKLPQEKCTEDCPQPVARSLAVSRDGAWAASAHNFADGAGKTGSLWDLDKGEFVSDIPGLNGNDPVWLEDYPSLLFSDVDAVVIADPFNEEAKHFISGVEPELIMPTGWAAHTSTSASPDDKLICVTGIDGSLRIFSRWQCTEEKVFGSSEGLNAAPQAEFLEGVIASLGADGEPVTLINPESGQAIRGLGGTEQGKILAASLDKKHLAVMSDEPGIMELYRTGDWDTPVHRGTVTRGIGISVTEDKAASILTGGLAIVVLDFPSGNTVTLDLPAPTGKAVFGPSGTLYTPHLDLGLIEWDPTTGQEIRRLERR